MSEHEYHPQRKRVLTEADIHAIKTAFSDCRGCRFPDITESDMVKVKEFVELTDKIKISILDKLVWVAIISLCSVLAFWPKIKELLLTK